MGVARHEKDRQVLPFFAQGVCQFLAVHVRHDHVGKQKVDSARIGTAHLHRLSPIPRQQDGIAHLLQADFEHGADIGIILGDENGLVAWRQAPGRNGDGLNFRIRG